MTPASNLPISSNLTHNKSIKIYGARENNLKNISIEIPHEKLVLLTGLSGSGKSSLAFGVIYSEGQRRYVESMSAYVRQFLHTGKKADVDKIVGLWPAIAIDQKTTSKNPRSTVGTMTEILDYLRLLFARVGKPYSPATNLPIKSQSVSDVVDAILQHKDKAVYITAPIARGEKGEFKRELLDLKRIGYQRIMIEGNVFLLDQPIKLDKNKKHNIEVIVDRLIVSDANITRITAAVETAFKQGNDICYLEILPSNNTSSIATSANSADENKNNQDLDEESQDDAVDRLRAKLGMSNNLFANQLPEHKIPKSHNTPDVELKEEKREKIIFSRQYACPISGFQIPEVEPKMLSFNNPIGACENCHGLGIEQCFDEQKIVPNPLLSIKEGALKPWAKSSNSLKLCLNALEPLTHIYNFSLETPFADLPAAVKQLIFYGTETASEYGLDAARQTKNQAGKVNKDRKVLQFAGLLPRSFGSRYNFGGDITEESAEYKTYKKCVSCLGYRLKPEMLCIKIDDKNIGQVQEIAVNELKPWILSLRDKFSAHELAIADLMLSEIASRLSFLVEVGLGYITLARSSGTLSGGESQRIRLASQIGSGLSGVIYVLDEPSIGLHARDTKRLIGILRKLVDQGNSVIVVEHDLDTIYASDHIIDIGPQSGINGGKICAQGTLDDIKAASGSLTADYLNGSKKIELPSKLREGSGKSIKLVGARANNLKNVTLEVPLGKFIAITGVSGGGKSTLIMHTLYKALHQKISRDSKELPGEYSYIEGAEHIDKIIEIDQSPIGRTPRSNIATYTGIFTYIRDIYANLPTAQARGYTIDKFSFNVKGGRCEMCQGAGYIKQEMYFMNEIFVECESCKGTRYTREILEIQYNGKSIYDVLELSVEDALAFFDSVYHVKDKLLRLNQVGLGYLKIGQSATTLSGGEAQRIKLAKELAAKSTGRTLYILDEPTTGLHIHDIAKLLEVLHQLTDQGNTVLVIEHNLDVIKTADYIVDVGPDGGDKGGEIVASGTLAEVCANPQSVTATFLKDYIQCN